jgi:hypothetical protein
MPPMLGCIYMKIIDLSLSPVPMQCPDVAPMRPMLASADRSTCEHIGRASVGYIAWKLLIPRAASTTSAIPAPGQAYMISGSYQSGDGSCGNG